MKIIEREDLDLQKWDALVRKSDGTGIFSLSHYMDSVAERWCVLVDDDYSKGIALPYVTRLGIRSLYTPIFLRYVKWLGEVDQLAALKILKSNFKAANLCVSSLSFGEGGDDLIFQQILPGKENQLNDQAKRMVKKFDKSNLEMEETKDSKVILKIIKEELPQKIDSVNDRSLLALEKLIENFLKTGMLKMQIVKQEDQILGGAFFIEYKERIVYLKSAFREKAKQEGAMYKIMQDQIQRAATNKLAFDFGGSRVEGVRRFNLNLGGEDTVYFELKWDNLPFWFKGIKKIKNQLK